MRRIGILTSGGDCQALNATMRAVAKVLYNNMDDVEIIGIMDGYRGLIHNDYRVMRTGFGDGVGGLDTQNSLGGNGLTGAGLTHDGQSLALGQIEADVTHCLNLTVGSTEGNAKVSNLQFILHD